jgi:hypothetical protein
MNHGPSFQVIANNTGISPYLTNSNCKP